LRALPRRARRRLLNEQTINVFSFFEICGTTDRPPQASTSTKVQLPTDSAAMFDISKRRFTYRGSKVPHWYTTTRSHRCSCAATDDPVKVPSEHRPTITPSFVSFFACQKRTCIDVHYELHARWSDHLRSYHRTPLEQPDPPIFAVVAQLDIAEAQPPTQPNPPNSAALRRMTFFDSSFRILGNDHAARKAAWL